MSPNQRGTEIITINLKIYLKNNIKFNSNLTIFKLMKKNHQSQSKISFNNSYSLWFIKLAVLFQQYNQLFKQMKKSNRENNRLGWTEEEEYYVKQLYQQCCIKDWQIISEKLNGRFTVKKRTPKQIRERYTNYIKFSEETPKISEWTNQEDAVLFSKYQQIGAKWVQISASIVGKSENSVKNRFYASLRKLIRKIHLIQKKYKIKVTYPIKYSSVLKMLQIVKIKQVGIHNSKQDQFIQLRKQILELASNHQKQINQTQIKGLITKFHSLSLLTRFINVNKGKKKNILSINKLKYIAYNDVQQKNIPKQQVASLNFKQNGHKNYEKEQTNGSMINIHQQISDDIMLKQQNQVGQGEQISQIFKNEYTPLAIDYLY